MMTDEQHAAFVRQEYRRVTASDASVYARNPSAATTLTIDTQMDHDHAHALANAYLTEGKNPTVYEAIVEGVGVIGDFVGAPPAVVINSRRYSSDARTQRVFTLNENFENNTTTLQVRG